MYSIQDVTRDEEGRWKCQKCLEHGKNPKTLAMGDEIQCRVCPEKTKNNLFVEEKPEMAKTAAVKIASGVTKLTTKEYNALLEQWLKEEKKKKKYLENTLFVRRGTVYGIEQEDEGALKRDISDTDKRIEALEKAIALNFDPDEFERITNVPLRCSIFPGSFWLMFSVQIVEIRKIRSGNSKKRITRFEISPVYAKSPNLTVYVFDDEEDYPGDPRVKITECPVTSIEKWGAGIQSGVCFNLSSGRIVIYHDARLSLSIDNPRLS